jgi:hypothetical protein
MKKQAICLLCLLLAAIISTSCSRKTLEEYKNDEYGFSFMRPAAFKEASHETDRFALLDKEKNAILFITNTQPISKDILTLGETQAASDLPGDLEESDISKQVSIMNIHQRNWFTYAIDFPGEDIKSIVSGTLCNNNEVIVVLVTKNQFYEENQRQYLAILSTFECT